MKLSDTASGALLVLFGMAIEAYAATFPSMPGQSIGPSFFPMLIGGGLMLFGATLALTGARTRVAPLIDLDDWTRSPRLILNFALVIAVLVFYAVAVDRLGFFLTGAAFLSILFLAFGVRRRVIAPLAVAVTMAMHYGFYTLLRVPLPWGVLEAIAW
jgi:putative tricarboxylic transport membrane protein